MSKPLPFRVVRISFDPALGQVVIEYGMPNGEPDVRVYPLGEFLEKAVVITKGIAFHITP
jgi:hypothetical protein